MEKNWLLFFPANGESYVHYELPSANPSIRRGRTFAKLLGNGLTTPNLTDPLEQSCLQTLATNLVKDTPASQWAAPDPDPDPDSPTANSKRDAPTFTQKTHGSWHQATNSLRLILCNRTDFTCHPNPQNTVFFAIIHRKFPNLLTLPLRYERFVMIWSATPPFGMLGISSHPLLLANETAGGFLPEENWPDDVAGEKEQQHLKREFEKTTALADATTIPASSVPPSSPISQPSPLPPSSYAKGEHKPAGDQENWAEFTYTVSMAYAYGRAPREKGRGGDEVWDMQVGYLDDEVVLGIGIDDLGEGFAAVRAGELVGCAMACPGRTVERGSGV